MVCGVWEDQWNEWDILLALGGIVGNSTIFYFLFVLAGFQARRSTTKITRCEGKSKANYCGKRFTFCWQRPYVEYPPHFPRWIELLTGKVQEQPTGLQLQGQAGGILTIQVQQKQPETGLNYNNNIQQGNNSMVSYQQSGYPQADNSQGSLINANQQQHHHQNMFNANTYS